MSVKISSEPDVIGVSDHERNFGSHRVVASDELTEVVDGEPVTRQPMGLLEGWVAGRCFSVLHDYARQRGGLAFMSGSLFKAFGDNGDLPRFPDASYVAAGRMDSVPRGVGRIAPDLCVEIISPTDVYTDVREKAESTSPAACGRFGSSTRPCG